MLHWYNFSWNLTVLTDNNGHFNVGIQLKLLFGFCEDYKKVIVNQELLLFWSNIDLDGVKCSNVQDKIIWEVLHISDALKLQILKYNKRENDLPIPLEIGNFINTCYFKNSLDNRNNRTII